MILKRIKEKSVYKIIKKEAGSVRVSESSEGKIKNVVFVIDYDETSNLADFYRLTKRLGIKDVDVRIIGFVSRVDKNKDYPIAVFSEKSLSWNGKIKDGAIKEFLKNDHDLLINYYKKPKTALLLISSLVKAYFRIGLGKENEEYNNLLLEVNDNNFLSFEEEVVKYLTILKKI